jgi:hypothetical protein
LLELEVTRVARDQAIHHAETAPADREQVSVRKAVGVHLVGCTRQIASAARIHRGPHRILAAPVRARVGAAGLTTARRCFLGGIRWTTTGGGGEGAGLPLAGGSTLAGTTAGDAGRARRVRTGLGAWRASGMTIAGPPSATRALSSATLRTSSIRSATNAVTLASISAVLLIGFSALFA